MNRPLEPRMIVYLRSLQRTRARRVIALSSVCLSAIAAFPQESATVVNAPVIREGEKPSLAESLEPGIEKYNRLNDEAVRLIDKGETAKAYRLLNEAISLYPDKGRAYVTFAVSHSKLGELQSAIRALDRAIELDPFETRAWYVYSVILNSVNRRDEAIAMAEQCIAHDTIGNWEYTSWLAKLLFKDKQYAKAAEQYEKSGEQLAHFTEYTKRKGRAAQHNMEVYEVRQETDLQQRVVFGERGVTTETVEVDMTVFDTEAANMPIEIVQELRRLEEAKTTHDLRYALCLIRTGRIEEGLPLLNHGFQTESGKLEQGRLEFTMGHYERAQETLQSAAKRSNSDPSALLCLLASQIAVDDQKGVRQMASKLKSRARKLKADWALDSLKFYQEYVLYLQLKDLNHAPIEDFESKSRAAFYKAQLHLIQDEQDLARVLLIQCIALSRSEGFEYNAAEAQLALIESDAWPVSQTLWEG